MPAQSKLFEVPRLPVGARVLAHYGREVFRGVIVSSGAGPVGRYPVRVDNGMVIWFNASAIEEDKCTTAKH